MKPFVRHIIFIISILFLTGGATGVSSYGEISKPTVTPRVYEGWKYFKNGYMVKIPPGWRKLSDKGGKTVLVPGKETGSVKEISFDVAPYSTDPDGVSFTSQEQFDQWYGADSVVSGKIRKIDNVAVDGERGIMLSNVGQKATDWHIFVWTRKDGINYYINARGDGRHTLEDAIAVDYLISSFMFGLPPK